MIFIFEFFSSVSPPPAIRAQNGFHFLSNRLDLVTLFTI